MCADVMVMSLVYFVSFTGACGVGMVDVYIVWNCVCDRTPSCRTPVFNWFVSFSCFQYTYTGEFIVQKKTLPLS